jgi:hypothetical protein
VATWQDANIGIVGCFGTLSLSIPPSILVIDPSQSASSPDVAAVQRQNYGTSLFEYWGLFTYLDNSAPLPHPYYLMESERCFGCSGFIPPTVYDVDDYTLGGVTPTMFNCPRIDAIDDYNNNNPGPLVYPGAPPAPNAYFTIAIGGTGYGSGYPPPPPSTSYLLEYNNQLGSPGLGLDITYRQLPLLNSTPTVACGPGPHYTIQYNSQSMSSGSLYAETLDWHTGLTTPPIIPPALYADLYEVPMTVGAFPTIFQVNAISATCNTESPITSLTNIQRMFTIWNAPGTAAPPFGIYDKKVVLNPSNPWIQFRQANTSVPNLKALGTWLVSPNPATDHLLITAPLDRNSNTKNSCLITDIAGREILKADIEGPGQQLNIGNLLPGIYLLHIYEDNNEVKTEKFVKE